MKRPETAAPDLIKVKHSVGYIWAIIVGIYGFALYANTIGHGFVLDDNAINQNLFVQEGIKGIPKLFTVDFWYFENLKLGYYRPLGLATFAIERQFFGSNASVGHFDNALFFGLSGFILCLFLLKFMPSKHPAFPFLICLVFISHPIHTEVVANIKSRDEILSFLNIFAMMYFMFRYQKTQKKIAFILSLLFFYLALLSKETAIVGIALLPLFLYYSGISIPVALKKSLPYLGIALFFFLQKWYFLGSDTGVNGDDIVNYPYTSRFVKLPTTFHVFALCLTKLVFPWPLSHDYSYNQIPASHWSDGNALLGLVLFIGLAIAALIGLFRKSTWGLGLSIIFITLVPSLAFVFLRGGIMAERFLYAPCLGFALLLVYALSRVFPKSENPKISLPAWLKSNAILAGIIIFLCMVYAVETVGRNMAWKDQLSLFSTDSKNSPQSCQVHKHYGDAILRESKLEKDSTKRKQLFDQGMGELQRALEINPNFGDALCEIGVGYQVVEVNTDSALKYYKKCIEIAPNNFRAYNNMGGIYEGLGNILLASYYYNKAVESNPQFSEAVKKAAFIKKNTGIDVHKMPGDKTNTPNDTTQSKNLGSVNSADGAKDFNYYFQIGAEAVAKGDYNTGIDNFKKAAVLAPENKMNLMYLANSYGMTKRYQDAVNTSLLILKKYPNDQTILKNLSVTYDFMGQKDKADEIRKRLKNK